MNVKGGGISYVNDFHSDEMRLFRGGLRHIPHGQGKLLYDSTNNIRNYHDKMSYERGFISHSRSPSNQRVNFHFMHGGFFKFVVQRHILQNWWRRNIRNWWLPITLGYTVGSIYMRIYDNAAYDYFYFSD
eukprot:TRINITY_DN3069_c0_g1_i1.p1 TRINITY_DN3069_c0_g1~~TRINITY_DN3069_c0_g1_i1.p1  ORF type:complete len:130 (+),score=27.26 TRINITY_DN3069_c0_g1_i1:143-532(+)